MAEDNVMVRLESKLPTFGEPNRRLGYDPMLEMKLGHSFDIILVFMLGLRERERERIEINMIQLDSLCPHKKPKQLHIYCLEFCVIMSPFGIYIYIYIYKKG